MSETGLQSGFYQQARGLAELVDDVLLSLKRHKNDTGASTAEWDRLGEILVRLGAEAADFQSKTLLGILGVTPSERQQWLNTGNALIAHDPREEATEVLRDLADRLETGQANAVARMRGRVP
ncbi:hypothetical protein ACFLSJ_05640 [Verrucomicrobiota bacterium]